MNIASRNEDGVWAEAPAGQAIYYMDTVQVPVMDPTSGEVIYTDETRELPVLDGEGNPVLDENEQPVVIVEQVPLMQDVQERKVASYETFTGDSWSEEERNKFGFFTVEEADPTPEGKTPVGQSFVEDKDGSPKYAYTLEDYVAPPEEFRPLSRKEFGRILAVDGVITKPEALSFAMGSALPERMEEAVEQVRSFNEDLAWDLEMDLLTSVEFEREHPNTLVLAQLLSTPELTFDNDVLDSLWRRGVIS